MGQPNTGDVDRRQSITDQTTEEMDSSRQMTTDNCRQFMMDKVGQLEDRQLMEGTRKHTAPERSQTHDSWRSNYGYEWLRSSGSYMSLMNSSLDGPAPIISPRACYPYESPCVFQARVYSTHCMVGGMSQYTQGQRTVQAKRVATTATQSYVLYRKL